MTQQYDLPPLPDYSLDDGAGVDRVMQDYARADWADMLAAAPKFGDKE